jgi:hypothetical protein
VPGDPVLDVTDADVALTGVYQGRRRMTLTYPMINRSRRILWLVTGSDKVGMLRGLLSGDKSIPARADEAGPCTGNRRPCRGRAAGNGLTLEVPTCALAWPPITAGSA